MLSTTLVGAEAAAVALGEDFVAAVLRSEVGDSSLGFLAEKKINFKIFDEISTVGRC